MAILDETGILSADRLLVKGAEHRCKIKRGLVKEALFEAPRL